MGYVLGLGGPYHHDASACLVDGTGAIVAFVEEERLSRRKHHKHSRSCTHAALFCLSSAGINLADVAEIAVAWNPRWPTPTEQITDCELIAELLNPRHFDGYVPARLSVIDHHLAHAASAFYPSGFPDAAVLVADGSGDGVATSIYRGDPNGLAPLRRYAFTQSLGWFYETVAEYIGLGDWTSTGKLMGLAAYGEPVHDFGFLQVGHDDGYLIDLSRYGMPPEGAVAADYVDLSYYHQLKRAYAEAFADLGVAGCGQKPSCDSTLGRLETTGGFTADQANLAASAQRALERCMLQLARSAMTQAGSRRLCIAGGVGLNCSANGVLYRHGDVEDLFVQPAAGDAGCAIGAALECVRRAGRLAIPGRGLDSVALGPSFDDCAIRKTLDSCQLRYTYYGDDIVEPIAAALASDAVVGWFQGPTEAGPRALGQRSILANPSKVESRDRINRDIKRREMWRPLAPSILAAAAEEFVIQPGPADFMIVAYHATGYARATIPATVHVDGSLRPHTVHENLNPRYARLLRAVEAETGVPALLNTSFNHEAEPIVCTPTDALRTFYSTPLDALALGGFLLTKDRAELGS
ncbi:MAG: carbamoyltransferase C-terminal domain-containing protein [Pseudonocardiaceae bacterium]